VAQLHRVGAFPPDNQPSSDYDPVVQRSMVLETNGYSTRSVLQESLAAGEFSRLGLDDDELGLAMHMALPRPATRDLQR